MRVTAILARVPIIKFRKGMAPSHGAAAPAAAPSVQGSPAAPSGSSAQVQATSAMSTAAISDIDLPPRYRRRPMSQEEIDYINGGGVV